MSVLAPGTNPGAQKGCPRHRSAYECEIWSFSRYVLVFLPRCQFASREQVGKRDHATNRAAQAGRSRNEPRWNIFRFFTAFIVVLARDSPTGQPVRHPVVQPGQGAAITGTRLRSPSWVPVTGLRRRGLAPAEPRSTTAASGSCCGARPFSRSNPCVLRPMRDQIGRQVPVVRSGRRSARWISRVSRSTADFRLVFGVRRHAIPLVPGSGDPPAFGQAAAVVWWATIFSAIGDRKLLPDSR